MNPVYARAILDLQMPLNDAGAETVRQYLWRLARQVWIEDEGFSGKRPFGSSAWSNEVVGVLLDAKVASSALEASDMVTSILDLLADSKVS